MQERTRHGYGCTHIHPIIFIHKLKLVRIISIIDCNINGSDSIQYKLLIAGIGELSFALQEGERRVGQYLVGTRRLRRTGWAAALAQSWQQGEKGARESRGPEANRGKEKRGTEERKRQRRSRAVRMDASARIWLIVLCVAAGRPDRS